jgi:non-heme chloroperoxidase
MKVHDIKGAEGLALHVREWGESTAPPILFIHGWSQNHLCWQRQYESTLADRFRLVALDLRGHGMSQAPLEAERYTQPQLWADDIAAVIKQLNLDRTVLVGWSYGGFVICDYLRAYGSGGIAGINFVGAAVTLNEAAFGTLIGSGFLDHVAGATSDDLPTNIETIRRFVRALTSAPLPADDFETALAWNMAVPSKVRAALVARDVDSEDVLTSLSVPVLVSHGREDEVILPAMGEHIVATCPRAVPSWYSGVAHLPFLEDADRFNSELKQFAQDAQETATAR